MKESKRFRRIGFFLLLMVMLFGLSIQASAAIRLSANRVAMSKGRSYTLKVSGTTSKVTFASADKAIATVTSKGVITGRSKGTVNIYAIVNNVKYRCVVMVRQPIESVTMKYSRVKISKGKTFQLEAKVGPANANNKTLTWTSSNPKVCKVNSTTGKITTIAPGTVKIMAKANDISGKYAVTVVEVKSSSTTAPPSNPTQSSMARKFLSILNSMSVKCQQDYAAGKPWKYQNGGLKMTFSAARSSNRLINCAMLPQFGMRELGILGTNGLFYGVYGGGVHYSGTTLSEIRAHCQVIECYKTPQQLENEGKLLPGDICTWVEIQHTNVYAGNGKWYESGRFGGSNGFGSNSNYTFTTWGPVSGIGMTGYKIGNIIRIVK